MAAPSPRTRPTTLGALLLLAWLTAPVAAAAAPAAEAPSAFLDTHDRARQLVGQPDRLIALWAEFAEEHAERHPLGHVARLNEALWMLHAASEGEADERVLALLAWPTPTEEGDTIRATSLYEHAHRAAMELRARVEMRVLAERLQDYYRRHVEYPPSLEALVDAELVSSEQLVDPFGEPYQYEPAARSIMPDIPRQRYTLRSASVEGEHGTLPDLLEGLDELEEDLEISTLVPEEEQAYVRERRDDGSWSSARRWDVGRERAGVRLWAVHDDYILVGRKQLPRIIRAE